MGGCCYAAQTEDAGQILRGNYPSRTLDECQLNEVLDALRSGAEVERLHGGGRSSRRVLSIDGDGQLLCGGRRSEDKAVAIADIVEVREPMEEGELPNADLLHAHGVEQGSAHGKAIAVIYRGPTTKSGRHFRSLCVSFRSDEQARDVAQCIGILAARARERYLSDPFEARVQELWGRADKNGDGRLTRGEVCELLQTLNMQLNNASEMFDDADADDSHYLDKDEFRWFFLRLLQRKEVASIFSCYAGGPKRGRRKLFDRVRVGDEVFADDGSLAVVSAASLAEDSVTLRWLDGARSGASTDVRRDEWSAVEAAWPLVVSGRDGEEWSGVYHLSGRRAPFAVADRVWKHAGHPGLALFRSQGSWRVGEAADEAAAPLLQAASTSPDEGSPTSDAVPVGHRWRRRRSGDGVMADDDSVRVENAIGAGGFSCFLQRCQSDVTDLPTVRRALCTLTGTPLSKQAAMSREQFTNYLLSAQHNSWYTPSHRARVYQDMDRPLSEYFINSSHNTYLTGGQLWSRSCAEEYKICLEKGCRCVELDCWNGSDDWGQEPVIHHGRTLTTTVSFESVCKVIDKYAFSTSEYPVILSLEVHTDSARQVRMVELMKKCFGAKLLPMPEESLRDGLYVTGGVPWVDSKTPFTPNGLRGRVLVKCKVHAEYQSPLQPAASPSADSESEEAFASELDDGAGCCAPRRQQKDKPSKHSKIGRDLSKVVFLKGRHGLRRSDDASHEPFAAVQLHEICSLADSAFRRRVQDDRGRAAMKDVNRCMFTRVYPAGTRVWSDNHDPVPAWNVGVQMVALNFQQLDFPVRLNDAKFQDNGGCGYLLKPEHLRLKDSAVTPQAASTLRVKVISGCQIPKPNLAIKGKNVHPYVCVLLSGIKGDSSRVPKKTRVIPGNGFDPLWNEDFVFRVQSVGLAMLTLRVVDNDTTTGIDDVIAEASVPLTSLRCGYRCVPLRNHRDNLELEHACLFCHFALEQSSQSDQ